MAWFFGIGLSLIAIFLSTTQFASEAPTSMAANDKSPEPETKPKSAPSPAVIAAGVTTLATMACFGYLFSVWGSSGDISPQDTIRLGSAQYVAGNLVVAGDLAGSVTLDEEDEANEPWLALQNFLVGAGTFQRATKEELPVDRREVLKEAIPALENARDAGFPEGRDANGHRMLGLAYYEMGDYDAASTSLQKAIDLDLTLRSELTPVLAIARAKRPRENLDEAIVAIDQVLAQESLDIQKRTETELLKIRWLIELSRFDLAKRIIENAETRIAPAVELQQPWALNAADALLLTSATRVVSQVLATVQPGHGETKVAGIPATSSEQISDEHRKELMSLLKGLAVMQREAGPKIAAQSRLTAARALLLAGERDLALAELTLVRQQRPFSDEGLEGGMSEMELLADLGLGEDVLQTSRYLSREIAQSRHLNFTPKLEAEFRNRVRDVLARLRGAEEFEASIAIADSVVNLFGKADAAIQQGIAYRAWGEATLKAGRGPSGDISRDSFEAARANFRGAGDAFATAAEEQFNTNDYVPTLWSAIDAYQQGRHFSKSIPLLEKYLRYEERKRQPRGLVANGRALLAEGQPHEAMETLQTCIIEFPRDPMRYEARLLAAQAAADAKDDERAKVLLQANLNDGQLTPQSPVWRDSLHTLGELLYAEIDMETLQALELKLPERIQKLRQTEPKLIDALRRLSEAVERYWPSPRSQAAAYLLARGQLLAARLPEAEMEVDSLLNAAKRDLRQKTNRFRQSALDQFASLVGFMDKQERDVELTEKQQAILRNSLLGQADTLKSMQRHTEAADAYRDMSLRYMNEPPALEALLGQARMVRLLGREREANLLIGQASVVLDRISEQWDDQFDEMTRFDREEWKKYLSWMTTHVEQASRADPQAVQR